MERAHAQKDLRRAIHRSRAFRARLERKRRRTVLLAAGAVAAALFGFEFSVASFGGMSIAEAAANQAKSLMELLDQRSPGERTAGVLAKTKVAREVAERERPKLLPKNLAEVLAPAPADPTDVAVAEPAAELPAVVPSLPGEILLPPPGGGLVPPPGVVVPPGGGGGNPPGGGGGHPPPGPPDHPPPPPLPEPGTWLTMILGFGMIGWMMRRERGDRRAAATR
jgi:hypothetical protein